MFSITPGTGAPTAIGSGAIAPQGRNPRGVAADPAGRYLFVTNRDSDTVTAFTIDVDTGQLTENGTAATGDEPGDIVVDPTGRWVFLAAAAAGTVRSYAIGDTG